MAPKNTKQNLLLKTALAAHSEGKLNRAIRAYRKVLQKGFNVSASNGLTIALRDLGFSKKALAVIEVSISVDPFHPVLLNTYGTVLVALGLENEAIKRFRESLKTAPTYVAAWANLGLTLKVVGENLAAKNAFIQALNLNPLLFQLNYELGKILHKLGDNIEAEQYIRAYLKKTPSDTLALNDLGNVIFAQGKFEDARDVYRQVVKIDSQFVEALNNLGSTLRRLADINGAIIAYDAALKVDPSHPEVRWNRALTLLLAGRYQEGFTEYEWRWKRQNSPPKFNTNCQQWDGGEVTDLRFLCFAEQGLGDTLQFSRYLPMLAARGAQIYFCCQPPLVSLFKNMEFLKSVFPLGELCPDFDIFSPLLDLPKYFDVSSAMKVEGGYFAFPEPIVFNEDMFRIGVVWAGNTDHANDIERSIKLSVFGQLFKKVGVTFFSLQVGSARRELTKYPNVIDLGVNFHDFMDTARAIAGLDLVISVDTAVAHLSAGMGKPTWVLLSDLPDWRWGLRGQKSCWYKSVHLFRQRERGDWLNVIKRVNRSLAFLLAREKHKKV